MNISKGIIVIMLSISALYSNAIGQIVEEWTSGDYVISAESEWDSISELTTRNNVTVTMPGPGGGVGYFWMYDDSELTTYDGSINYLYLYDNASATFFEMSYMNELYIDPALENSSQVTLYATFDRWEPSGPNGRGHLYGNWLTEGTPPFVINLVSDGAYSKVQFIPEPATLLLFGLGALTGLRRRMR